MKKNIFDIHNKVIIITGGMGQLGRQFGLSLSYAGAKVAIFDIKIEPKIFEDLFHSYIQLDQIIGVTVDITSRSSIEAGLRVVNEKWGVPFGLINAAAID